MADKELKIKITVDDTGAIQKIEGIDDAVDKAGKSAEKAGDGFSKFQANLLTAEAALSLAGRAFDAIQRVAAFTFDTLDRAAQVENLTRSFENLQESIGNNATSKLEALRESTRGLVSDQELLQQANQAVLLGVDDGSGKFEELSAAAIKLGQAQGITAAQAIESLTVGIGRQSKQVLDNLGIIVEAEKAYEAYALSIGKTVEQLSDQERRLAFNAAAFDGITTKAQNLSGAQETAAQSAQGFSAQIENLRDRFALAFSSNEELNETIKRLGDSLKNINIEDLAADFATLATAILNASEALAKFAGFVSPTGIGKNIELIQKAVDTWGGSLIFIKKPLRDLAVEIAAVTKTTEPNAERLAILRQKYFELRDEVEKQTVVLPAQRQRLGELRDMILDYADKVEDAQKSLKGLNDETKGSTTPTNNLQNEISDLKDEFQELQKSIEGLTQARFDGSLKALENSVEDAYAAFAATGDIETFKEELGFIAEMAKDVEGGFKAVEDKIKSLPKAIKETLPEVANGLNGIKKETAEFNLGEQLVGSLAAGGGGEAALVEAMNRIMAAIGQALKRAIFEGASGRETGAAIGAAVGAELGIAGNIFGEKIGEELGGAISSGYKRIFNNKSDEAANARENFFDFLRETFEGGRVLIDGEMKELGDLFYNISRDVFDPTDGRVPIFDKLLEQAPEVKETFLGVGNALSEILQIADLDAAQIAALLNDAIGGSLNNLQVLIDNLGLSVADLEDALVTAAKNGELSFLETEIALRRMGDLAQQGIPGQVGAVTEAFENLKAAGAEGGAFTIDALRDIGAEAAELGATTLQDLRAALEEAGVATDDLNKFFESLAEVGVDSVEELANVTDREAIQVLADLETLAFGFLETTNQAADDLISRLENIPDEIESRIVINVETRASDNGAQQVIDSGQLGLTL
jgi:predicted  nucleic acid-binding Zn-ribbon protein